MDGGVVHNNFGDNSFLGSVTENPKRHFFMSRWNSPAVDTEYSSYTQFPAADPWFPASPSGQRDLLNRAWRICRNHRRKTGGNAVSVPRTKH